MLPTAVSDNVKLLGPVGQVSRGVLSARRATKFDNPIVWAVEAASLLLNMTGSVTASKALRLTAAACTGAFCIAQDPRGILRSTKVQNIHRPQPRDMSRRNVKQATGDVFGDL